MYGEYPSLKDEDLTIGNLTYNNDFRHDLRHDPGALARRRGEADRQRSFEQFAFV